MTDSDHSPEIAFPSSQLRTDAIGFDALGRLHKRLSECSSDTVIIDCARLFWLDGHLSSPFLTVLNHCRARHVTISFKGLKPDVRLLLRKNGLLEERAVDSHHTTIPVTTFGLHEEVAFADFSRSHLARPEMPKMSKALQAKIFEAVDELFANCALHSKSPLRVVTAGQFFPRTHRLAFAISDGGRGVDGSLRASKISFTSPTDAIDWAMEGNNTTRKGDIPGGLGLKLLRRFIERNQGKLTVVSNAGYWCQEAARVRRAVLRNPFPGTAVILEISTSDRNSYDLAGAAPRPEDIW